MASPQMRRRKFFARKRAVVLGVLELLIIVGGVATGFLPHQIFWTIVISIPVLYFVSDYIVRKLYG
jgi:hypothetical protein